MKLYLTLIDSEMVSLSIGLSKINYLNYTENFTGKDWDNFILLTGYSSSYLNDSAF